MSTRATVEVVRGALPASEAVRYAWDRMSNPELPGPACSLLLLAFAAVCAYGAKQIHPGYSYRLGHVSPLAAVLVRILAWSLAVFLAAGGTMLLLESLRRRRP